MNLTETRKGDLAIIVQCVLWGLFPVITVLSYSSVSPIISLACSVLLATLFFAVYLTFKKKWRELADTTIWKDYLIMAILIGVLYYGLYYYGLKYTKPGNASLIALLEFFYSFLFFNVWKKQYFSFRHILGALLMIFGAAIILFPKAGVFNKGDLFVAVAILFAPIVNHIAQRLLKKVSSETIMFARSLLTLPFAFLFIFIFKEKISFEAIQKSFWLLLINGFLVLGLAKIFWLEGIHRIPVTKAAALLSVGPLFTLLYAFILLHQIPTIGQLSAFVPLAAGLFFLTSEKNPLPEP